MRRQTSGFLSSESVDVDRQKHKKRESRTKEHKKIGHKRPEPATVKPPTRRHESPKLPVKRQIPAQLSMEEKRARYDNGPSIEYVLKIKK